VVPLSANTTERLRKDYYFSERGKEGKGGEGKDPRKSGCTIMRNEKTKLQRAESPTVQNCGERREKTDTEPEVKMKESQARRKNTSARKTELQKTCTELGRGNNTG